MKTDWIQTYTGKRFYPLEPREEDVCIEDIAHALSLKCRFAGHCIRLYSVAEHSVLPLGYIDRTMQLQFLLHDAAEAYLFDAPRPIKQNRPQIKEDEDRVLACLSNVFGVDLLHIPKELECFDMRMLATEYEQNMVHVHRWESLAFTDALDLKLQFWSPERAEEEFRSAYEELAVK